MNDTTYEEIKEEDIMGRVEVTIDKNAFNGPFTCCGRQTAKAITQAHLKKFNFEYEVWRCGKCGKEYLDSAQAGKMETLWKLQLLLGNQAPKIERSLNYDGKTYFVRFPKDLTGRWAQQKKGKAILTMLTPEKYFIEIV